MSHRMTRGQFFQLVVALLDYQETSDPFAYCASYTNGCNECFRDSNGLVACDKRMCVWQGIPKCYACDSGYTLENNRCVKQQTACIQEGKYAGGGYVMYPENLSNFQCCS